MIPVRSELPNRDEEIVVRARARAKAAWSASLREDDRLRRAASEERLAASWPRPRVLPVRSFVMGAAAAACLMLVAFVSLRAGGSATVTSSASSTSSAQTAAVAPIAAPMGATAGTTAVLAPVPVGSLPSAGDVEPRGTTRGMVVTGACPDCRVGGSAMEPGLTLGAGRALSVPRGARVTLGFAMSPLAGGTTRALIDPAVGIDVEGPAVASSQDDRTVALDRGSARFRGLRDIAVAVPGGRLDSAGATFTVRVDAHGVARITVESGRVVVTSQGTNKTEEVEAGTTIEVAGASASANANANASANASANANANANANASANASANANANADGRAAANAPASGVARPEESLDAVSRARAQFHEGDTFGARTQLEALARSHDAAVAQRASFTLAEIEMASGERERGRARLAELTRSADVRLASDAATLLARSEPTAAGRAGAWERYLATSPPTAYRDRALLERAEALLDAGRTREANAILAELRGASLSEAQQRQLERLSSKASERR